MAKPRKVEEGDTVWSVEFLFEPGIIRREVCSYKVIKRSSSDIWIRKLTVGAHAIAEDRQRGEARWKRFSGKMPGALARSPFGDATVAYDTREHAIEAHLKLAEEMAESLGAQLARAWNDLEEIRRWAGEQLDANASAG